MHKIVIPQLPSEIEQFGACVLFEEDVEELMAWARNHECKLCCRYGESGQEHWLSLAIEACGDEEHVHFHIEMARVDLGSDSNDDREPVSSDEVLNAIDAFLDQAEGIEAIVRVRGRFRVPRREIPEHGAIGSLLSFKQKAAGTALSMKSAELDVDHEWFTRMDFNYDEEAQEVRTQLWAIAGMEIEVDFLEDLAELMTTGADCFIFERVSKEATT